MDKNCYRHPSAPAVGLCTASMCQQPICSDCIVQRDGGIFCSDECALKQAALGEQLRNELAHKTSGGLISSLLKLAVVAAVIIGILELLDFTDFFSFI